MCPTDCSAISFVSAERALQDCHERVLLSQRKAPMAMSLKSFWFRLLLLCDPVSCSVQGSTQYSYPMAKGARGHKWD